MEKTLRATHGDHRRPLRIGNAEIPCFVLEDGRRVITQRGLKASLGFNPTGGARRLVAFAERIGVNRTQIDDLTLRIENPIKFRIGTQLIAHGYEAQLLADLCDSILEAREQGKLLARQRHIAKQAEILVRGFAVVGIIALIDEATGYQASRTQDALAKILDQYISKKLASWAKTFPDDFYREMARLKGWDFSAESFQRAKRPGIVGRYTKELVYSRLAPGVIEALESKNPTVKPGQRQRKHHQWLTPETGHPALREHLAGVIALMKASKNWNQFMSMMKRSFPRIWDQMELDLGEEE